MRDRDSWLNATMIELADIGDPERDEAPYVGKFTDRVAELLGPVEVSLLLLEPANRGKTAPSGELAVGNDELATALARLEADGKTGPCTTCYRIGRPVPRLPLAQARERWPEFTDAAIAAGLATCWALPLRRQDETIGAVSVLAEKDYLFPSADYRLALTLAEMATIGILRQRQLRQSQRLVGQLQRALDSRVVIEQAKGAVSARLGVTPNEAFELLRSYSRSRSRPLAGVAADVLADVLPASALIAGANRPTKRPSGQGNSACRALSWERAGFAQRR